MGFVAFTRKEFYIKLPAYESMEQNGMLHFLFNNSTSPRGQWVETTEIWNINGMTYILWDTTG